MGTLVGPMLGAVVFLLLEEVISGYTTHWKIIFGPLLVLFVLFVRRGLYGLFGGGKTTHHRPVRQ
jgi:branched-chain amino acid transport system permease protein